MAFSFEDMKSELSEMQLISVPNIDVLKSRSRLLYTVLDGFDITTENPLINADYHVKNFKNELPSYMSITAIARCNRELLKYLGDSKKKIYDFKNNYHLSFLIVTFHYYGCDDLQEQLIDLIAETPDVYLTNIMEALNDLSGNSDSIKTFVKEVKYNVQLMKILYEYY